MSKKDLQFIDQALAHPWMFWVYFWKWPRIVRQACAEYDLLAKERDVAKEAHEQAVRANKIVRDWIHVTHRLDLTADMRAIWTAGKRLSALLLFLALTLSANAQLPPILRNQWTTNANPLALKVISTNGVHAATNVWELDFTNTATVTVSAVSNANKVMVSFTGSASSGSSSLTNALLHAGPTNGSVDALILTAGNGVTLTTSGTNRIAAIDTNVVAEISDLLWTNVTVPASGIGGVGDVLTSLNPYQTVQITTNFLSFWGDGSMSMLIGYGVGDLTIIATNNIGIVGIGDYAFQNNRYTNCQSIAGLGLYSFANSQMTGCDAITGMGDLCFQGVNMIETTDVLGIGGAFAIATFQESSLILGAGTFVGRSAIFTNCDNFVSVGQESLQSGRFTNCNAITSFGYQSLETAKLTDCNFLTFLGPNSGTNLVLSGVSNAIVVGNIRSAIPVTDEFWFGSTNNVYRFPGNIGTIRGVSGYSWPTAHAAGVWTNDGAGVTGWKPLSDFSGGGSGIGTNSGTGWDTSIRSVSTNTVPLRIESEAGLRLTNFLQVATNSGAPFFVISSNKFVGIGTNSPAAPLHVRNIGEPDAASIAVFDSFNQGTVATIKTNAVNIFAGTFLIPSLTLGGDSTCGWYRNAANQWTWVTPGGTPNVSLISSLLRMRSLMNICWAQSDNSTDASDVGIVRNAAGVLEINSTAAGARRDLLARTVTVTNLVLQSATANRAAIINANNNVTNSATVDTTELESLDGVTSAIQTQLNGKQVGSEVLTNLTATKAFTNVTRTVITNVGVSLYTVPAGCKYIYVECIGGGGGGGGVDGAASQSAAGGGGGSGAYCTTNIVNPADSYIVTVGTNGLGGAAAAGVNNGTIGGTTLFTNILTALGGSGGSGDASAAAVGFAIGGAGALETATGYIYSGGSPGQHGICMSGTLAVSGGGAGSIFGGGGAPQTAAAGANATGKGAGGSGAAATTNVDRAGGNGSPGMIMIREYYQ